MAGRSKLTEDQRAAKQAERELEFGTKPKKNILMDENTEKTNNPVVNTNENNPNPPVDNTNTGGENNPAPPVDNTIKTDIVKTENTPADQTKFKANTTWKPFKGNKIERDYSTPKIDSNLENTIIPEVPIDIQKNNVVAGESTDKLLAKPLTDSAATDPNTNKPVIQKPEPLAENWNQLTEQEQELAAAQAADMGLGIYDKAHYFGRMFIKVDDEEIVEMHNDDKIDMNAPTVENDENPDDEVTIRDFWKDFNKQVDGRFIVTDKFKADVRPAMIRMCKKYGIGASDGMFLIYKFGEDALTKIAMLAGFKKTVRKMNEHFEKQHAKFKAAVDVQVQKELERRGIKSEKKEEKKETPDKNNSDNETKDPNEQKKEPEVK
jgi:hypothetical protein